MLRGVLLIGWITIAGVPGSEPAPFWTDVLPLAPAADLSAAGAAMLEAHVEGGVDAELRWWDFRDLAPELRRVYAARGWRLAWTSSGRPTDAAWQVAALLAAADRKGLDPRDYAGDWERRLSALERGGGSEPERIRLDVALTVSALRFAGDLAFGRIRPTPGTELLGREQLARHATSSPDLGALVEAASAAADPGQILSSVEPARHGYQRTLAALERELARLAAPATPPLPLPAAGPVAPERYDGGPGLAARLRELGDLRDAPEPRDDGEACTSPLTDAVVRFQSRHGLDATGFVDAPTVQELNAPVSQRVGQLERSLERWRWFPRDLQREPIVVNVPEFALRAENGGRPIAMRVVVGQAYEWGTPVFASELTSVVFRPTWTVPLGIQQEEILPRIASDRGYIAAGDFDVVDASEQGVLPLTTPELLSGLRSGALKLRQRPGPGNALGLVKFVLSRSAWIYLHGTPAPELFSRSRRDFSHGCIRVEDPATLAAWVLREEPGWTPAAIRGAMAGGQTQEIPLQRPIPVQIGYFTAAVWEDGVLRYSPDVYGQDAALAQALDDEARRRGGP
jgi:murein L,D-transpeptidase YcbB/YkuD